MVKLGDRIQDKITGFCGIAVARCEYLNGCVQFQIQPQKLDKEKYKQVASAWFDEQQVEVMESDPHSLESETQKKPGGPKENAPSRLSNQPPE